MNFMLYVDNAGTAYEQALSAGITCIEVRQNMFWDDRNAKVSDGRGYEWAFAHQIEEVSAEEIKKRAKEFAASIE